MISFYQAVRDAFFRKRRTYKSYAISPDDYIITPGAYASEELIKSIGQAPLDQLEDLLGRVELRDHPLYVIETDETSHSSHIQKLLCSRNTSESNKSDLETLMLFHEGSPLSHSAGQMNNPTQGSIIYALGYKRNYRVYLSNKRSIIIGGTTEDEPFLLRDLWFQYRQLQAAAKHLDQAANIDGQTSLTSRYQMELLLDEITASHERRPALQQDGKPYALIMADVDKFKIINDTYGYKAGDQILRQIAQVLIANCPSSGKVARWGGDEFLIALTDCPNIKTASLAAERLLSSIIDNHFCIEVNGKQETFRCTISLGLSFYDPSSKDDPSLETMLALANKALRDAKGGDRVIASNHGNPVAIFSGNHPVRATGSVSPTISDGNSL